MHHRMSTSHHLAIIKPTLNSSDLQCECSILAMQFITTPFGCGGERVLQNFNIPTKLQLLIFLRNIKTAPNVVLVR